MNIETKNVKISVENCFLAFTGLKLAYSAYPSTSQPNSVIDKGKIS